MKCPTSVMTVLSFLMLLNSASISAQSFLADRHVPRFGGQCSACHQDTPPKSVSTQDCLKCHGPYGALAKRTENRDINPHDSHLGEAQCSVCHRGHKASVLACDECHQFGDMKVP